jgi:hypothetical protein
MKTVAIQVTLTEAQAWEFAQFLKRICFSEYRSNATSDEEASLMRDAGDQIRRALTACAFFISKPSLTPSAAKPKLASGPKPK